MPPEVVNGVKEVLAVPPCLGELHRYWEFDF